MFRVLRIIARKLAVTKQDKTSPHGCDISPDFLAAKGDIALFEKPFAIYGDVKISRRPKIGAYTYFRTGIIKKVESIGRYCSIGPDVVIGETEHPTNWLSTSPFQYNKKKFSFYDPDNTFVLVPSDVRQGLKRAQAAVVIGHDVWVGARAIILSGVTIGNGAIIGAGAVVTRDVAPYTIVGGVPAKEIGRRFDEKTAQKVEESKWWQYDAEALSGLPFHEPLTALEILAKRVEEGKARIRPEKFYTLSWNGQKYSCQEN